MTATRMSRRDFLKMLFVLGGALAFGRFESVATATPESPSRISKANGFALTFDEDGANFDGDWAFDVDKAPMLKFKNYLPR